MNAVALARTTYTDQLAPSRAPRDLEFDLLARITARLSAAHVGSDARNFARLVAALDDNRKLWQAFGSDVATPLNALPPALRAQLFYLSEFVALHSDRVLDGKADAGVLIDINTAIMRGLRGGGPQ